MSLTERYSRTNQTRMETPPHMGQAYRGTPMNNLCPPQTANIEQWNTVQPPLQMNLYTQPQSIPLMNPWITPQPNTYPPIPYNTFPVHQNPNPTPYVNQPGIMAPPGILYHQPHYQNPGYLMTPQNYGWMGPGPYQ